MEVGRRRVLVGRDAGCDLTLPDARVSAAHLELFGQEGGVVARDLLTTNGTFAGKVRIRDAVLGEGAELRVGGTLLRFTYEAPTRVEQRALAGLHRLVGSSPAMQALYAEIEELAPTEIHLLLEGETGTGKEEVARSIHAASARADGPFVVVDCGALAPTLLESILFGHERGAFSGANERRIGLLEAASGGTLLLDELGELPMEAQTRLLRALEARTIRRVGSTAEIALDVRVVSATHRDLPAMISAGSFRADLFFRLAAARIHVAPLRERRQDVRALVHALLVRAGHDPPPEVTEEAFLALERRDYPGNVRELRNVLEVAVAVSRGGPVDVGALSRRSSEALASNRGSVAEPALRPATPRTEPAAGPSPGWSGDLGLFREEKAARLASFERGYLEELMRRYAGNISHAAAHAGIERHYLRKLLRKHDLPTPRSRRRRG